MMFGFLISHRPDEFGLIERLVRMINIHLYADVGLEVVEQVNVFTTILKLTKGHESLEGACEELEAVRKEILRLHHVLAESKSSNLRIYFLKKEGDKWVSLEPSKPVPLDEPLPKSREKAETD